MTESSKERPKIQIIQSPLDRPTVQVVSINSELSAGQKPRVVSVSTDRVLRQGADSEVVQEAAEFSKWCRGYLKVTSGYGFYYEDIQKLVEALKITPSAFLIHDNHWTLAVSAVEDQLIRYNPVAGLETVMTTADSKGILHYFDGKNDYIHFSTRELFKRRPEYQLPQQPLKNLGRLQYNSVDCGPLTVYAAKVALGK